MAESKSGSESNSESSSGSKSGAEISVALVHWPVYDRAKNEVCTNVTNFDVHDIARAARSYGLKNYYIVNRVADQLTFVSRLLEHWRVGEGSRYNPMRRTALTMVQTAQKLEEAIAAFDEKPLVVGTTARKIQGLEQWKFRDLRAQIEKQPERPVLLVFGTGFGLSESVFELCDLTLEPIMGAAPDEYRHFSVRSAVSICLDRLLGTW